MKMTSLNKTLLGAAALALLTGAAALAADLKPVDYRRTLFAPMGQDTLMFEAPKGMCFLDSTKYLEGAALKLMAEIERKKGEGVLLGAFSNCDDIANLGGGDRGEGGLSLGSLVWLNPSVGEKTPLERADFLDTIESDFKEKARSAALGGAHKEPDPNALVDVSTGAVEDYVFDDVTARSENGVAVGFTREIDLGFEKTTTINVVAATSVRHYPIKVALNINPKRDQWSLEQTRAVIDKFLAQQIALNE